MCVNVFTSEIIFIGREQLENKNVTKELFVYTHVGDYYQSTYINMMFADIASFLCFPRYEFRLRVSLASDGNLNMISRIRNIDSKPFSFSFGYHTYLPVSDIRYALTFL